MGLTRGKKENGRIVRKRVGAKVDVNSIIVDLMKVAFVYTREIARVEDGLIAVLPQEDLDNDIKERFPWSALLSRSVGKVLGQYPYFRWLSAWLWNENIGKRVSLGTYTTPDIKNRFSKFHFLLSSRNPQLLKDRKLVMSLGEIIFGRRSRKIPVAFLYSRNAKAKKGYSSFHFLRCWPWESNLAKVFPATGALSLEKIRAKLVSIKAVPSPDFKQTSTQFWQGLTSDKIPQRFALELWKYMVWLYGHDSQSSVVIYYPTLIPRNSPSSGIMIGFSRFPDLSLSQAISQFVNTISWPISLAFDEQKITKAAEYEKFIALSKLLTGLRHDLGTPTEHIDIHLRKEVEQDENMIILSDFILSGLAGYQFMPAMSGKGEFLGLEQSLKERVQENRMADFPLRPMLENCIKVLDICLTPLPKCHIRCDKKYLVHADYQLLMLAMYNLLKNAREKANAKIAGKQRIIISVQRRKEITLIKVSDANRPISAKIREQLFKFETTGDSKVVSGIGLPLAYLFIQAHPGSSREGRGVISYKFYRGRNVFSVVIRG